MNNAAGMTVTTNVELCATFEHQKRKRYELLLFRTNATGKMVSRIEPHPWPLTAVPTLLASLGCAAIILISTGSEVSYRHRMMPRTAFLRSKACQIANHFPKSRI
jgi:hypothetical protein